MSIVSQSNRIPESHVAVSSEIITTFSRFTVKRVRFKTSEGAFEDLMIVERNQPPAPDNQTEGRVISCPLTKVASNEVADLIQFIFGAGYRLGLDEAQQDLAIN